MNDFVDEEMNIANEQDSDTALSSETFLRPVSELYLPQVISISNGATVGEAVDLMQSRKIGSLVIVDGKKLCGIFTERDVLMKVIGKTDNWREISITDVMTGSPQSLQKEDEIAYVLNNMHVGGYRHVPIVSEDNEPISMVSIKDVVSWILDHFPQEVTNLTGEPFRGTRSREGA